MVVTPIPARRRIRHKIEVLRLGEWVDLSAFLARAEYNLGDHTAVGTDPGGTDGVARTASITLKNSGEMQHYWQSTLTRYSDDVVSDDEHVIGWSDESADKILQWLFGPSAGWSRQNLAPRDQNSPINQVEIDGVMQYVPLLWPNREIRGWGRTLAELEFQSDSFTGDGATDTYVLTHAPVEPETVHIEASGGPIDWEIDGWTGTLWLSRPLASGETLTVDYSHYTQDTGWVCEFHGVLGGNIAMDGHAVNLQVVDLSKRLQDRFIEDATEPYSGPMEQVMQAILDDHFGAGTVQLFFPSGTNGDPLPPSESPTWMVTEYIPEHVSVFDALGRLASRRGWYVGYRWHAPTQQMQLQLMSPPRDKDAQTADVRASWLTDFYEHELSINDTAIRNRITVEYRDADGELQSVPVENQDSIDEYGLRSMFIGEDETSEIRDHDSAMRLANAALADLSDMTGTSALDMPVIPGFDVFMGIALDDPRISSTEDFLGVENVTQIYDFEGGHFRTRISGTNRVIGGRRRWLRMEPRPGAKPPVPPESVGGGTIVIPAPVGVQWESIPGGITVTVPKPPVHALRWSVTEVHISDTDGFTPDDTTLAASNRATEFTVSPLAGGETVYVKAAYVDVDGKRYAFSAQVTGETGETDPVDTTPPATPTGLVADFSGPDLVLRWDPVERAVEYRIRINDSNGQRREVHVSGSSYTYSLDDNRADGTPPRPSLTVQVWAKSGAGVYSTVAASVVGTNHPPAEPEAVAESSMTQLRWRITSELPRDLKAIRVTAGTYTQESSATHGVIDLEIAGIEDSATEPITVVVIDVFGQESDPYTTNVTGRWLSEKDMAGALFQIQAHAEDAQGNPKEPTQGTLDMLWDGDTSTFVKFDGETRIVFRYPTDWLFDMFRVFAEHEHYCEVEVENNDGTWTSATPIARTSAEDWTIRQFHGRRMYSTRALRITLLPINGPDVSISQLKFWTITMADEILAQNINVTRNVSIEGPNGSLLLGDLSGKPWGYDVTTDAPVALPAETLGMWGDRAGIFLQGYMRVLAVKRLTVSTNFQAGELMPAGTVINVVDDIVDVPSQEPIEVLPGRMIAGMAIPTGSSPGSANIQDSALASMRAHVTARKVGEGTMANLFLGPGSYDTFRVYAQKSLILVKESYVPSGTGELDVWFMLVEMDAEDIDTPIRR